MRGFSQPQKESSGGRKEISIGENKGPQGKVASSVTNTFLLSLLICYLLHVLQGTYKALNKLTSFTAN